MIAVLLSMVSRMEGGGAVRRFGCGALRGFSGLVLCVGMCINGCASGSSNAKAPVTSDGKMTHAPSSAAVSNEAEEQALAAYRAMWRDMTAVSASPDPNAPRLRDHATNGALQLMKYGLTKAKKEKVVSKGRVRVNPEVVETTTKEVKLQDCADGTEWLQYKLNGELKNTVPGSHFKVDARVLRNGTVWKVSYLYMYEAGTC